MAQQYRVSNKAPQGLNLRSAPVVKDSTKIAVLPVGQLVTKKGESSQANWWEITTTLNGTDVDGFVNNTFLLPDGDFIPPLALTNVAPVHLSTTRIVTRGNQNLLAYPLNEIGQKTRDNKASIAVKAAELTAIVNWLDVENQPRYAPNSSYTYCNIYAYDYAYLSGVYLPRVWWTKSALNKLEKNLPVSPLYEQTVRELRANDLFDWFKDFGPSFGWNRTFDLAKMQDAANSGLAVIICGQNKIPNESGHICPVVPETTTHKAKRNGTAVVIPLQSQTGRNNHQYFVNNWWIKPIFREFGFWINEL